MTVATVSNDLISDEADLADLHGQMQMNALGLRIRRNLNFFGPPLVMTRTLGRAEGADACVKVFVDDLRISSAFKGVPTTP